MTSVVGVDQSQGDRLVIAWAAAVAAAALAAWPISGHAVAVPLVGVGAVSITAGVADARSCLIPNRVVLAGLIALLTGALLTAIGDGRSLTDMARATLAGVIASGAPLLAITWLVRPSSVGGGDVKLLAVQGAAIGLVAPLAAPLVLLGGSLGGLAAATVLGRRTGVPLGPGLAVGFLAAVAVGFSANVLLGGKYG